LPLYFVCLPSLDGSHCLPKHQTRAIQHVLPLVFLTPLLPTNFNVWLLIQASSPLCLAHINRAGACLCWRWCYAKCWYSVKRMFEHGYRVAVTVTQSISNGYIWKGVSLAFQTFQYFLSKANSNIATNAKPQLTVSHLVVATSGRTATTVGACFLLDNFLIDVGKAKTFFCSTNWKKLGCQCFGNANASYRQRRSRSMAINCTPSHKREAFFRNVDNSAVWGWLMIINLATNYRSFPPICLTCSFSH